MLSTLLITVPPMAGMWFNGIMASYSGYNTIQGWGNGQPATPPGMNSQQQQANYDVKNMAGNTGNNTKYETAQSNLWTTGGSQTESTSTDTMKQPGQFDKRSK